MNRDHPSLPRQESDRHLRAGRRLYLQRDSGNLDVFRLEHIPQRNDNVSAPPGLFSKGKRGFTDLSIEIEKATRGPLGTRKKFPLPTPLHSYELKRDDSHSKGLCAADNISFRRASASCIVLKKRPSLRILTVNKLKTELPSFWKVLVQERAKEWAAVFRRTDPRYRILKFFDDVAQEGAKDVEFKGIANSDLISPLLRCFQKASVFSVWRPTSMDAIRKMMTGEGVGKGLDIKGKSAKAGKISGFVPFVQIHALADKKRIRSLSKENRIRIFYQSREHRDQASKRIQEVTWEMVALFREAQKILEDSRAMDKDREIAYESFRLEITNPRIGTIDDFEETGVYGLEIPERVLWEVYVMRQDISRKPNTENDTQRSSEPAFQDMNFKSLRHACPGKPRPVVFQYNKENPLCPLCLLMAYEGDGKVKPVVSDFDCFLMGTRGVSYEEPLPPDQIGTLQWCVENIAEILAYPGSENWTSRWLEILKKKAKGPAAMPDYGYADPKSYAIMKNAVDRLKDDGCVRHGSESFNYYFPQELDSKFLVISDSLPGNVKWRYVDTVELQSLLLARIDEGFTFPLNPKWVLCDPGWKAVYDKLLTSHRKNVQDSINLWFPPEIRERIEEISKQFPRGFRPQTKRGRVIPGAQQDLRRSAELWETTAMDRAQEELDRFFVRKRVHELFSRASMVPMLRERALDFVHAPLLRRKETI